MNLDQKIVANYLLGSVRFEGEVSFYMNPLAYWIMDCKSYDPNYDPANSPGPPFRDGIFVVDDNNVDAFLKAVEPDRITFEDIVQQVPIFGEELSLYFLIDFNENIFVNGYSEVEIEKYVPLGWKGIFDNPLNYLPDEVRQIWQK